MPGERGVEVLGVDVEAAEVFLRFRRRRRRGSASRRRTRSRRRDVGLVKADGEDPGAGRPHLLLQDTDLLL
jgi:hypothetical protein